MASDPFLAGILLQKGREKVKKGNQMSNYRKYHKIAKQKALVHQKSYSQDSNSIGLYRLYMNIDFYMSQLHLYSKCYCRV